MDETSQPSQLNGEEEIQNWLGMLEAPFHQYNLNYEEIQEVLPSPIVSPHQHSKLSPTGDEDYGAPIESKTQTKKKRTLPEVYIGRGMSSQSVKPQKAPKKKIRKKSQKLKAPKQFQSSVDQEQLAGLRPLQQLSLYRAQLKHNPL